MSKENIFLNIIKYAQFPLKNGIEIVQLTPKEEEYNQYKYLGSILKSLRREYKERIFFQDKDKLYLTVRTSNDELATVPFSIWTTLGHIELVPNHQSTLFPHLEQDNQLLRNVVGEAVASFLRYKEEWRVEEHQNAVYYAEEPVSVEDFGPIEVWKGFEYAPLVYPDGSVALIIDPRFRFYTKTTLREQINQLPEESIEERYKERFLIDTCPVSCPYRRDPYADCSLSGSGKYVKIVGFDFDTSPSEAPTDLIKYHQNLIFCPKDFLGNFIQNIPPIAKVLLGNKIYYYPLERLREIPKFDIVPDHGQRRKLMDLIQLKPLDRAVLTHEFRNDIRLIPGEELRLEIANIVYVTDPGPWNDYRENSPTKLKIGSNIASRYPIKDLERHPPYDIDERGFHKIQIFIISPRTLSDSEENGIKRLLASLRGDSDFPGISSYFNLDFDFLNGSYENSKYTISLAEIDTAINQLEDIVSNQTGTRTCGLFFVPEDIEFDMIRKLRGKLLEHSIPNQGIRDVSISGDLSKAMLRNLSFGIYNKCGGVPWVLENPIFGGHSSFLGLSSLFRQNKVSYSLQIVSSEGKWKNGLFRIVPKEDYSQQLKEDIHANLLNFSEEELTQLMIHKKGRIYEKYEKEVLENITKESNRVLSVAILEILKSPIRIYRKIDHQYFAGRRGTAIPIAETDCVLMTTSHVPRGTPDPIIIRIISGDSSRLLEYTSAVYQLAQCYTGYDRAILSEPITTYAASRALSSALQMNLNNLEFEKKWFV